MGHLKSVLLIIMFIIFLSPGILLAGDTPSYEMGFYGYPLNYIRILKHETFFPEGQSLYVTELEEKSRFTRAGMRKGDIITSLNGRRINSYKPVQNIVNSSRGSTVSVVVSRLSPRFRYKKSKDPFYKPRS